MKILLTIHILVTILLIAVILVQKSDGGGFGASSSSGNAFSARGAANLLTRTTAVLATIFMLLCIGMSMLSHKIVVTDSKVITRDK
ncbi:MAG: hypothetical protein CNLJKLNK_00257 [Holosporales bacterium]